MGRAFSNLSQGMIHARTQDDVIIDIEMKRAVGACGRFTPHAKRLQ